MPLTLQAPCAQGIQTPERIVSCDETPQSCLLDSRAVISGETAERKIQMKINMKMNVKQKSMEFNSKVKKSKNHDEFVATGILYDTTVFNVAIFGALTSSLSKSTSSVVYYRDDCLKVAHR